MWTELARGGGAVVLWLSIAIGGCGKIAADTSSPLAMGGSSGQGDAGQGDAGQADAGQADAGAPGGGGDRADGGCSLVHRLEVPFTNQPQPFVVKAGVEFAVSDGATLSVSSWSGELGRWHVDRQSCADCDGLFGLTALRAPSEWRLLSIDRVGQGASARAYLMNDPSVPEAVPLFGPGYSGLVSAFALRASRDGTRALFANGQRVVTSQLTFALLDQNAQMVAPASTLELPFANWDYLSIVPTEHAAALSVTAASEDQQQRVWMLRELDASGDIVFASQVNFPPNNQCLPDPDGGGCVVVADEDGYYVQLVSVELNAPGKQRIARVLRDRPNELAIDEREPPGVLVGTFPETLVFREEVTTRDTLETRFVGRAKSGAAESQTLFVPPVQERTFSSSVHLIATEGDSLFYSFQTSSQKVIEEVVCPAVR